MTPFAILSVVVTVLLTALLLVMEHWYAYTIRQQPPAQPWSYAVGSLTVWLGFALWAFLTGDVLPTVVLGLTYVVGGGLVIGMHLMEQARDGHGYKRTAEQLTMELRDGQD